MRMNRPTAFGQSIFIKGTITSFYRWGKVSPLSHTAEMRKRQDWSVGGSDTQAEHDFTWFGQKHKRWEKTRTPSSCGARWVRTKAMSFGKQHYQRAAKTQAQPGPGCSTHHLPSQHSCLPNVCELQSLFHFHLSSMLPPVTFPNTNLSLLFPDFKSTA